MVGPYQEEALAMYTKGMMRFHLGFPVGSRDANNGAQGSEIYNPNGNPKPYTLFFESLGP